MSNFFEKMWEQYKDELIEKLFSDESQEKLVKALNDRIDIPFIGEKTEAKYLNAMWDTVEETLKPVIKKL